MAKRKVFVASLFIGALLIGFISGCKKDSTGSGPGEPISLVKPDSAIKRVFAGDLTDIQVQFTTDRPINWIKGMYDIDSLDTTGYVATYPDTLFFVRLDSLDPRVNQYTYTGSFTPADTLRSYSVVRFKMSFNAGKSTFTTGQNYPAGIVSSTKEFRFDIR